VLAPRRVLVLHRERVLARVPPKGRLRFIFLGLSAARVQQLKLIALRFDVAGVIDEAVHGDLDLGQVLHRRLI
jgi:predicted trehalose synthase